MSHLSPLRLPQSYGSRDSWASLRSLANHSDENERRFFWYPGEDERKLDETELQNTLKAERFYYDTGEVIRFRVDSIEWNEHEPGPPKAPDSEEVEEKDPFENAGFRITAAVGEQGLGLISWWGEGAEEGEAEEEYAEAEEFVEA